ncbi:MULTISPECIES: hypothetical protein [Mucilaginibacter]|nr:MULTISPECIES: hypothetical protein [Mucilaginibacter]QEM13755.1 hypothetical protein DEO27_028310 [Mucilaginibacter rubeus]QTE36184.1 hypothetical protein J3L18_24100 [Mucilaginibacter gossypii]
MLTRLGVPPELQAFFNIDDDLDFDYCDAYEHCGEGFHKIPTTQNLWVAGNNTASTVIITYSVMEAIAFLTLHRHRYPRLEQLAVVAIGNRFYKEQANWIRENFRGRKFVLVFGKDLIGHLTDIKLTAGIKNLNIRIFHSENQILIYRGNLFRAFDQERISLHAFQEAFSIRPRFRTGKPVQSLTFLDQLKHDAER